MPLVEVTHAPGLSPSALGRLAGVLPHAVSVAVECPEEPYDGDLRPGDVEVRFRAGGALDVRGLDVVVEVRSKWTASREVDRDARCERLCAVLVEALGSPSVGVYLTLPVAGWAQGS